MKHLKSVISYLLIVFAAFATAMTYIIFVFPNQFAPAGLDGVCTMIMDLLGINIGYLALLMNIPLMILAFRKLNREYVWKTVVYLIVFSVTSVIFKNYIDLSAWYYRTASSTVLAPVAAGTIKGLIYALIIRQGGSNGGVDTISSLIRLKRPHLDFMRLIFGFNTCIALCSYFVYGFRTEPVLCAILYFFVTTTVSNAVTASRKAAVRLEIITPHSRELCDAILRQFDQTVSVIPAKGAVSGQEKEILLCVTGKEKAAGIERLVAQYPDSLYFESVIRDRAHGC